MPKIDGAKVCVVGGAGFLGSHLVNHLIKDKGCEVLILDNLSSGKREFLHPQAQFVYLDITNAEAVTYRTLKDFGPEYLFNYAACPYVPLGYERPMFVSNVNAFGAMKVINAATELGVKKILQVSSAELYGDRLTSHGSTTLIGESYPVSPHSTYGASKAMVDFYVQARWREAKTPCLALRQFNCIGERETHPYVLTEIISQLHHGDGRTVRLGNNSNRDFLYAGDAVRYATMLLEDGECGEVYNLGSQEYTSVYDLAKLVGLVMDLKEVEVVPDASRVRPWEIWHLCSDNSKFFDQMKAKGRSVRKPCSLWVAVALTLDYYESVGRKWVWER